MPQVVVLQLESDDTRFMVNSYPLCQHSDKFLQDISIGKSEIVIDSITSSETRDCCIKFMYGDNSAIPAQIDEGRFSEIFNFAVFWEITSLLDACTTKRRSTYIRWKNVSTMTEEHDFIMHNCSGSTDQRSGSIKHWSVSHLRIMWECNR